MQLMLTENDLSALKPATRADILAILFKKGSPPDAASDNEVDWDDVVDLTSEQMREFMNRISDKYAAGLRLIAEQGPVIRASLLNEVGIENHGHFQGRTTLIARTVTENPDAFLLGWDDWNSDENGGVGHYGVTNVTYRSLCKHFNLPS